MEMRRFLQQFALFALACGLLYPLVVVAFSIFLPLPYVKNVRHPLGGNGHMYTRLLELEGHGPVDVLFLGSSHTYRGFDPRIWEQRGYSSFNLGSSSQSPVQTELLVKEYLDQLRPKLAVYEVYGVLGNLDGVESALDLIANRKVDLASMEMVLRVRNMLAFNSMIYGTTRQLLGVDQNFTEVRSIPPDRYIPGGYVQHEETTSDTSAAAGTTRGRLKVFQWHAFQRTIALFKERGVPVVLVEAPTTRNFHQELHATPSEVDQWLRAKPNFLDMNGVTGLADSTHFYDRHHLRQQGVILFNNALIDSLAGRDLLPSPHVDARRTNLGGSIMHRMLVIVR